MIIAEGISFLDFKIQSTTRNFPESFAEYVKSKGDVYFWEKGHFHVVTNAELAKTVLTSPMYSADRGAFFISRMPDMDLSLIQDFFSVVKKMMVMSDDGDHAKKRQLAARGFEDHIIEQFSKTVDKTVKKLVSESKKQSHFDFTRTAEILPSAVLADLFDIPDEERKSFFEKANTMTGFFGGASAYKNEDGIKVNEAARSLKHYFQNLMAERRGGDGADYVSILLRMQPLSGLSDDDIISQLIMMFVAGQVTTTDQINNIMFLLADNINLQQDLKNNPTRIPQALEELKRIDPAVTFIFRVARSDGMLGEQPIKKGDVIFISTHAVNRDLTDGHFAYGYGSHYCLGAKLGRLEIRLLFEEILKELPLLKLDTSKESIRDHYSLSFSGFKTLHLQK